MIDCTNSVTRLEDGREKEGCAPRKGRDHKPRNRACDETKELETHGQPDGITAGMAAEHVSGHQPGAGDEDILLAAVELQPQPQRVEGVEAELTALIPEIFGAGPFQYIAQGAI